MNLRQSTLVQQLPNDNKGPQTRLRGVAAKKELEQVWTASTEVLLAKETRKRKQNKRVNEKIEDYYDMNGSQSTIINEAKTQILQDNNGQSEKEWNQQSISSVSTNTTLDFERVNHTKSVKHPSDFTHLSNDYTIGSNSNTMQLEDKVYKVDLKSAKNVPLDFKQFLDETQKQKIKLEEELKSKAELKQKERKNLLSKFDSLQKKITISSTSSDLISNILKKSDKGSNSVKIQSGKANNNTNVNQSENDAVISTAQKIDLISEKLYSSLNVNLDNKIIKEEEQTLQIIDTTNQMQDEKYENQEVIKQKQNEGDSVISIVKQQQKEEGDTTNQKNESYEDIKVVAEESTFERLIKCQKNEKVEQIMMQPSIKQKYEELIAGDRIEFTIPYKYKLILEAFQKLDECISFFKDRSKPTLFKELKLNMEQSMRSTISIKQLQQIIFLYPQAYQIKWAKNDMAAEKWDLNIHTASDENEKREVLTKVDRFAKLKQAILAKIKYYHLAYLRATGRESMEKELLDNHVWHQDFDIQNIPSIEEAALPLKPYEIKVEPLQQSLQKNAVKNDLLARLMQSKVDAQDEKERNRKELIDKSLYISTKDNKSGLSDRLYQLIKAKEQKLNEEKMSMSLLSNNTANGMHNRIPEIKKVVEIIIVHYIQRKVSNMFYVNLIEHILSNNSFIIAKKDVIEIIDHLIQTCPFWITSIPNKQGNILRIDKTIPISKILAQLEK